MSTVGISLVPWGVLSTMGDILSTVGVFSTMGDILSTMRGVQYHRGYHDAHGGYHEYCGGVQYHGGNLLLFEYPTVLNTQRYS